VVERKQKKQAHRPTSSVLIWQEFLSFRSGNIVLFLSN
jgi:hypothetical protein